MCELAVLTLPVLDVDLLGAALSTLVCLTPFLDILCWNLITAPGLEST
jgi:hypothetical protein